MKNILKTVAMVLVVVMVANSFTGCIILGKGYSSYGSLKNVAMGIDLVLVIAVVFAIVSAATSSGGKSAQVIDETGTPQMAINTQSQTYALSDQLEQFSVIETLKGLPKPQIDTLTQKVQAVPEAEQISFLETFNAMSRTDRDSIMEEFYASSETELENTVRYLNSLSELQFSALLKNAQDNVLCEAVQ